VDYIILLYLRFGLELFAGFIVAIHFRNAYNAGHLSGPAKYFALIFVLLFVIADVAYNYMLSLPFWELPKSWKETTSDRIDRYAGDFTHPKRRLLARILGRIMNIVDPAHIPNA
jgi:hypothetical protein